MTFGLEPDALRGAAVRIREAGLDIVDVLPVAVPDTGATCDRTAVGLGLIGERSSALATTLGSQATALQWMTPYTMSVDEDVASRFGSS